MFTYLPSPSCRSLPMPSQCRITNRIRTADSYILNIHNLGMHHKAWLLTFLRKQNQNKICRMHSQTRQPVYPVSMSHWIIQVKTNPVSVGFGPLCCCLCPSPTVYHQSVPSFCTSGSHRCVPSNPSVLFAWAWNRKWNRDAEGDLRHYIHFCVGYWPVPLGPSLTVYQFHV